MADETRSVEVAVNLVAGGDLGARMAGLSGQADALGAKVQAVASGAAAGAAAPVGGAALAALTAPTPAPAAGAVAGQSAAPTGGAAATAATPPATGAVAAEVLGVRQQYQSLWSAIVADTGGGSAQLKAAHKALWGELAQAPAEQLPQVIANFKAGIGPMLEPARSANEAFASVGSALSAVGGAAAGLASGGLAVLGVSLAAVSALNPAAAQGFSAALEDVSAIIGDSLSPVVEIVTEALRELQPVFLAVGDVLSAVVTPIVEALRDVLSGPLKDALQEAVQALVPLAELIGKVFGAVIQIIAKIVEVIAKGMALFGRLLGIDTARSDREGATSASRQQAGFGDVAGVQNRAIAAALGNGNIAQQQLAEQRRTNELLARQNLTRPAEPAVGD